MSAVRDVPREMKKDAICPDCGSARVVTGRCYDPMFGAYGHVFKPHGIRFWSFGKTTLQVKSADQYQACLSCGLLWARVSAKALTKIVGKHGKEKLRRRMID